MAKEETKLADMMIVIMEMEMVEGDVRKVV